MSFHFLYRFRNFISRLSFFKRLCPKLITSIIPFFDITPKAAEINLHMWVIGSCLAPDVISCLQMTCLEKWFYFDEIRIQDIVLHRATMQSPSYHFSG